MKLLLLVLTYAIGLGEIVLGIFFWATNSKNDIRRIMAFLALATGLWVTLTAASAYVPEYKGIDWVVNGVMVFGLLLLTLLVHLSVIFPYPIKVLDRLHLVLLYLPVLFFSSFAFFTKTLIQAYVVTPDISGQFIPGPLYSFYNVYSAILFCAAIFILGMKLKKSSGIHQKSIGFLLFTIIIGGMPGVISYLILPLFTTANINGMVGVISSGVWLGGVTYIVARK